MAFFSGIAALLIWSLTPLVIVKLERIPIYEFVTMMLMLGFCVSFMLTAKRKSFKQIACAPKLWIVGTLAITFYQIILFHAFRLAPPEHIELLTYLWPIFMIIFSGLLPKEHFTIRHLFAAFLGVAGVYFIIMQGGSSAISAAYMKGYLLTILVAVIWATYMLVARHHTNVPSEITGFFSGGAALISLCLHYLFESFVMPDLREWPLLLFMGIGVAGISFPLWDFGIKKGNFKLLGILSYFVPLLSVMFLIFAGVTQFSSSLLIAFALIFAGSSTVSLIDRKKSLAKA